MFGGRNAIHWVHCRGTNTLGLGASSTDSNLAGDGGSTCASCRRGFLVIFGPVITSASLAEFLAPIHLDAA